LARTHWRPSRCPFAAAFAHVHSSQGRPWASAYLRTLMCPPVAACWHRWFLNLFCAGHHHLGRARHARLRVRPARPRHLPRRRGRLPRRRRDSRPGRRPAPAGQAEPQAVPPWHCAGHRLQEVPREVCPAPRGVQRGGRGARRRPAPPRARAPGGPAPPAPLLAPHPRPTRAPPCSLRAAPRPPLPPDLHPLCGL